MHWSIWTLIGHLKNSRNHVHFKYSTNNDNGSVFGKNRLKDVSLPAELVSPKYQWKSVMLWVIRHPKFQRVVCDDQQNCRHVVIHAWLVCIPRCISSWYSSAARTVNWVNESKEIIMFTLIYRWSIINNRVGGHPIGVKIAKDNTGKHSEGENHRIFNKKYYSYMKT